MIWAATLKQYNAEGQVAMLKHRLFCKSLPRSFDALDQALDDLNQHVRQDVIDRNVQTMITSRREKVIGQLKLDMTAIQISTAEAIARGHANVAKKSKEKLLLLLLDKALNDTDRTMLDNVINAIQARQENIIQRTQYVTSCKVSFFDETPTLLIESTTGNFAGVQGNQ